MAYIGLAHFNHAFNLASGTVPSAEALARATLETIQSGGSKDVALRSLDTIIRHHGSESAMVQGLESTGLLDSGFLTDLKIKLGLEKPQRVILEHPIRNSLSNPNGG